MKKKKITCFLFGISIMLFSCDPEHCLNTLIENKTDLDLHFVSDDQDNKTLSISKQNVEYLIKESCHLGGGGYFILSDDSIYITSREKVLKVYHPDDGGRNIYLTEDENIWQKKVDGNTTTYTFTIKEEDLFDNDPKE